MSLTEVLDRLFDQQPAVRLIGASLALVILVGWVDFYIDPNTSLSIFYILPIAVAAWYSGSRMGWIISIFSAMTWTFTYYASGGPIAHSPILFWNGSVRLAFFGIIASLLAGLKEKTLRLNDLAHVDSLTETFNSRAFYLRLDEEIKRSRRYRRPFSVAYIDLDNFKAVNDLHGHAAGDRLLREVSAVMKKNARGTDCIARMGGDEFTILLPEAGTNAARDAVGKIREELLRQMREQCWLVTCSIGLVTYEAAPEDAQLVVKASDDLMYSVKKNGKNGISHRVWDGTAFQTPAD